MSSMLHPLVISAAFYGLSVNAANFYNGLAVTPQMGWDNWNAFGCAVSEDLLLGTATKIVEYGLRDVGYHYVILDDCWSEGRNASGALVANSTRFPNGMAHVANSLHAMGLGFGMYSSAGTYTCAGYAGSLGHEKIDAETFASWGVDYLKYDNCYNEGQSGTPLITYNRYKTMSVALNETGRPILYSLCNWGSDYPWQWAQTMSNSWRISGDIYDNYDRPDPRCPCTGAEDYNCALPGFHCSMINILDKVSHIVDKGIPGAWNDLDALEVGNGGMTDDEYKTHFTMWAAVKSPLIMGNDIRALGPSAFSILANPAILAISQDTNGGSVVRRWRYYVGDTDANGLGQISMWSGSLSGGDYIVILVNGGNDERIMNATLSDIFIDQGGDQAVQAKSTSWDLHDLWANRMDNATANMVLNANSTVGVQALDKYYYNATAMSYAEGLAGNNSLLMGTRTGSVAPMGTVLTTVARHGVAAYRMRPAAGGMYKRNEL